MPHKKTKRSEEPRKSVLSVESQLLLEEIFAFFYNREAAKKDPDFCLEAMLTQIHEDLVESAMPFTAMLQLTLDKACTPGAIIYIKEEKERDKLGKTG